MRRGERSGMDWTTLTLELESANLTRMLEQIVDNLIRNAVNYSRESNEIRIALEWLPEGVRLEL